MSPVPTGRAPQVTQLRQAAPVADERTADRAMIGACLLGALDHFGAKDLRSLDLASKEDVRLSHLIRVFRRSDTGLHGCGFEYAVHHALDGDAPLPPEIGAVVRTAVATEVGAIFARLDIPWEGWTTGLRSVMFGIEKTVSRSARSGLAPVREAAVAQLGPGALLWPTPGDGPVRLAEALPTLRYPSRKRGPGDAEATPWRDLWFADLFLGGARVDAELLGLDDGIDWTAWLAATLKYRSGRVVGGRGIHLGIESSYDGTSRRQYRAQGRGLIGTRQREDLRILTLPLDGEFMETFNYAFSILRDWAEAGGRMPHPTSAPLTRGRELMLTLTEQRRRRVADLADELLRLDEPAVETAHRLADGRPGMVERFEVNPAAGENSGPLLLVPIPMPLAA